MINQYSRLSLVAILVSCLVLVCIANFGVVHASTDVTGIISSDTTWTKADSPYSLTGPILVKNGVTLTVEPGVTVYLNDHYILVNGTLAARGTSTDKIYFEISDSQVYYLGHGIEFTSFSSNWDEQTGSGCVIENAVVNTTLSISNSPRISNNIINERIQVIGEPSVVISNNTITDRILVSSQSTVEISNNNVISQKDYTTTIDVTGGSVVIANNNITSIGNVGNIGISIQGEDHVYVCDNIISGFRSRGILAAGRSTIERNSIFGNTYGIVIGKGVSLTDMVVGEYSEIIIRNNTLKDNSKGIYGPTTATTIVYNNIHNNTVYNIGLRRSSNVTVANNWWGTTDTQTINQTMFDFKKDFNLGTVNFIPFLAEPNPETEPRPTQVIPEFSVWAILPTVLCVSLVAVFCKRKLSTQN
ncbi:MAG: right-handed parallel beta-helix repeat-containing protein [Candidatus Bathyarchaeota archaeon]|nr:right-handed parallel beta-helix repeat-containing protein [Candidatus Bathyarchaeota archaeon]